MMVMMTITSCKTDRK